MNETIIERSPSLSVEQYSPEQIQEMIDHPSELALERMETIGLYANKYRDLDKGFDKDKSVSPMSYFLKNQDFGYYDELVVALHGSDDDLGSFMQAAAERDPTLVVYQQEVFREFIDPEKKRILCQSASTNLGVIYENFNLLAEVCEPADRKRYANKALALYGGNLPLDSLARILVESDTHSLSQKQKVFKDSMEQRGAFFWSPLRICYALKDGAANKPEAMSINSTLECIGNLVKQGVVDPVAAASDLDKRIAGEIPGESRIDNGQFREEASSAKLLLTLRDVLPRENNKSDEDLATDYINNSLEIADLQLWTRNFVLLAKNGYIPADKVRGMLRVYDAKNHTKEVESFDADLDIILSGKDRGKQDEHHSNDELINECYDKLMTGDDQFDGRHPAHFYREVINYNGNEQEKAKQLVEDYSRRHALSTYGHVMKEYARIFADEPDRLRATLSDSMKHHDFKLELGSWKELSDIMGFDRDYVKNIVNAQLATQWSTYNFTISLEQNLKCSEPLLSPDECALLLAERIVDHELESHEYYGIVSFCEQYLGSSLTTQYIYPLLDAQPVLRQRLGVDVEATKQEFTSQEYYDIYNNSQRMDKIAQFLNPIELNEFIEVMLDQLSDEHIADTLWSTWWYMDANQKETALGRMYKNPMLMAMAMTDGLTEMFVKDLGHDRVIKTEKSKDILRYRAPKAYATLNRRLESKSLPHETQLSRIHADTLKPEPLENGRRNILVNYAYYYDLCNRLKGFDTGNTIMGIVKGKNTEKNELRSLELLTLLRESAGVENAWQIAGLTKTELESLGVESVFHRAGLDPDKCEKLAESLKKQGVDVVKYGMWLHTSFRSQKLKSYLSEFLQYTVDGHSLSEWKLHHPLGNNLPKNTDPVLLEAWSQDTSEQIQLPNNTKVMLHFTNDINTTYMCGVRPISNCLHYAYGLNQRALAGLLNADSKILSVDNENGNPIANAILRLTGEKDKLALALEPLYTSENDSHTRSELHRTVIAATEQYAASLGLPLQVAYIKHYGKEMLQAVQVLWSNTNYEYGHTLQAPSLAPFTYGDATGVSTKKDYAYGMQRKKAKPATLNYKKPQKRHINK